MKNIPGSLGTAKLPMTEQYKKYLQKQGWEMKTENTKRANWLELLFDLIFVYAVSKATHILAHVENGHLGMAPYITFILVMVPIWWAWTGHTLFATRFDTEDSGQKLLTLSQMLAVVFWTSFINADFDGYYRGYLLFYVLIRVLLILMYWRVTKFNPLSIPIAKQLGAGFSIGILVALGSLFFEPPTRYIILYAGIGIEIITPLLCRKALKRVPVKSHHLPERYGLLTIILLGESVIIIAVKLNEISWGISSVSAAISGFILLSTIWWMYFTLMESYLLGRALHTGQRIIYGHLFIYLGLSAVAVFIGFSIKPELMFYSHLILLLTAFSSFFTGLLLVFGFKSLTGSQQKFQLMLLLLSAGISLFFSGRLIL